MNEIMTLDDLEEKWSNLTLDCECHGYHADELRQLAIKWVKEELKIEVIYSRSLLRWRERFNLNEEDLK